MREPFTGGATKWPGLAVEGQEGVVAGAVLRGSHAIGNQDIILGAMGNH